MDAQDDLSVQAGGFHAHGCAIRRHPDTKIRGVLCQLWGGGHQRIAQIAEPEIRNSATNVLAHLEHPLLDAQGGFLLIHLVHPAHLLGHAAALGLRLQVPLDVCIYVRYKIRKAGLSLQLHRMLKTAYAVVQRIRHTSHIAGIGGVGILDLLLAQILPHGHAQQTHQGAYRLCVVCQCFFHKALLAQAHPGAAQRTFVGLHYVPLDGIAPALHGWILCQHGLHIVGRVAHDLLHRKGSAVTQVAVLLQNAGEQGRYPVAVQ